MRVAVLSDIHGNSIALRAALAEMATENVDLPVFLGDFVGYYYDACGVFAALDAAYPAWAETAILGNHDQMLLDARNDPALRASYRSQYGSALDIALETLPDCYLDRLAALPEVRSLQVGGAHISLHHGAPFDPDAYIYPDAATDRLCACAVPGADWVLMGHTHYPLRHDLPEMTLLNPGSVGQARDIGGAACWALIDLDTKHTEIRRTAYDTSHLVAQTQRHDPVLPYLGAVLTRNKTTTTVTGA
jgi:putative phosphoesterase